MPSTFTSNLALEKQATGEHDDIWGDHLNTVLDQISRAIADRVTITLGGDVTLTAIQYERRAIEFAGTLTANATVIFPPINKGWLIKNSTAGAFTLTCKTAGGTGVIVSQGDFAQIEGDGTNIISDRFVTQDGQENYATTGGAADAYTLTLYPAIAAYRAGQKFRGKWHASNATTTPTLAVSGLSAKTLKQNGSPVPIGQLINGQLFECTYDGTDFQLDVSWTGVPGFSTVNTFTQPQGIIDTADPASSAIAQWEHRFNSATVSYANFWRTRGVGVAGQAADEGQAHQFLFNDSAGSVFQGAAIIPRMRTATAGATVAELELAVKDAGFLFNQLAISEGIRVGLDNTHYKGFGTVNAGVAYYTNDIRNPTSGVVVTATTPINLTAADHGKTYHSTTVGDSVYNLPSSATIDQGWYVRIRNVTTGGKVSIVRAAADQIISAGYPFTTLVLPTSGDDVVIQNEINGGSGFFYCIGSRSFVSTGQTITSSGNFILTHQLGSDLIHGMQLQTWIRNVSGGTLNGWIANEEVQVNIGVASDGVGQRGFSYSVDRTQINLGYTSTVNVFSVIPKTGGAAVAQTNANWNLFVRAFVLN